MNTDNIRWKLRFDNYEKAVARLEEACELEVYKPIEQAGLVQMFEFTFELAWKVLKDILFVEGIVSNSPRDSIRRAFETGYLCEDDTETLLDALDKRNLLSHTYNESTAEQAVLRIKNDYAPVLGRLYTTLKNKKEQ